MLLNTSITLLIKKLTTPTTVDNNLSPSIKWHEN